MSKKMLKRSLALGALMAFVITGSAMAEEPVYSKYTGTGTESHVSNVYWDGNGGSLTLSKDTNATAIGKQHGSMGLKNFSEIIFDGQYYTSGFLANPGNITLDNIGTIKQTEGSYVTILFSPQYGGNIVANVKDIIMNDCGNAIYCQSGSTLTINASGDVELGDQYFDATLVGACNLSVDRVNVQNTATINAENVRLTAPLGTALKVESYKWTTGEPPYDSLTGKNLLDINVRNNLEVNARVAVEAKNGTLPGNAVIDIDADNEVKLTAVERGINARDYGTVNIDAAKTTITTNNSNGLSYGIDARNGSSVNVNGDLVIDATSTDDYAAGIYSVYDGDVTLGSADNKSDVSIKATCVDKNADKDSGWDNAYGVYAYSHTTKGNNGVVNIFADNLNITVDGAYAYGVFSGSNVATGEGKSSVVIDANKTQITATSDIGKAAALTAYSGSELVIKGDLVASGDYVLQTRGGATVKINESAKNTVNLTGDICFAEPGAVIDADVLVNLSNDKSTFKGNIYSSNADRTNEITGMKINLSNGATWELSKASIVNEASFGAGTNLVLKGDGTQFTKAGDYALNGVGTADVLKVDGKANIKVEGIDYKKYNVATGFEDVEATETYWNVSNLNTLMQGNWIGNAKDGLQLEVVAKAADKMETEMGVSNSTAQSVANVTAAAQAAIDGGAVAKPEGTGNDKAVALVQAMANANPQAAGQAFEAVSKMAEAGGNSGTAASIVKNVTGVTNDRLSFNCGHSAPHKGGHGVGLFEEGSGADIWVEYVHGKDKVEDMPSTAGASSYEGQYNGIVMGVDFKKVNKFQSGVAFNYGEGDTNSVGSAARTHSDYDFWGIGYHGNIHNDDSNVIFDIGYAKTDSDVETKALGMTYNASPETTTWTAGVKVEKLYQNENVQIVPYTGLRFMSIDPEDYTTECASSKYDMERQNVWLLPLGVSIKQEVTNDNGWTVSPRVDLSYIWAFGDTDSGMEFSTLGTKTNIDYEVMDDGSFLGLVGIEARKGQWGYGVSYSYQKGNHSESKKWYVDVNYSF